MEAFGRKRRNRDDEENGGIRRVGKGGGERKSNSLNSIFTPWSQSYKN